MKCSCGHNRSAHHKGSEYCFYDYNCGCSGFLANEKTSEQLAAEYLKIIRDLRAKVFELESEVQKQKDKITCKRCRYEFKTHIDCMCGK
jgi:hypothetical protein